MKVALAQVNSHLGNFRSNSDKILSFIIRARDRRADVVLFPESTLFGYHPMDLLERPKVVEAQLKVLKELNQKIPPGILVILGAFTNNTSVRGKPYFNSAVVLEKGKAIRCFHKELLPTYDVFDDARHIEPGDMAKNIFRFKGKKILITICEDIWAWPQKGQGRKSFYDDNPIKKIKPNEVDLVFNLSASPFTNQKIHQREQMVRSTARYLKAPMFYVNMVGGQDELIFDGGSFAVNKSGGLIASCSRFQEDLLVIDTETETSDAQTKPLELALIEQYRLGLSLGIRDFVHKCGLNEVHLGLSGGIDSAVVACLAVDALGPQAVRCYALPGPFSSKNSLKWAKELSQNLGLQLESLEINSIYKLSIKQFEKKLGLKKFGLVHENLQARIRGIILMAAGNLHGSMLLNTSNKSELATGYSTLYGDLCGGLCPIGDLLKNEVYALAKHYNSQHEVIPQEIIDRAPSAELRKNQKDQDSLPPYEALDKSVINLVEKAGAVKNKSDAFVLQAMMKSEFKRWQAPPILKVRDHSFGRGRRWPVAHKGWF